MNQNEKTEGYGAMIGILIVIVVLLFGGYYFVQQRMEKSEQFKAAINREIGTSTPLSDTPDEILNIESDAQSMNFDNLGSGIDSL